MTAEKKHTQYTQEHHRPLFLGGQRLGASYLAKAIFEAICVLATVVLAEQSQLSLFLLPQTIKAGFKFSVNSGSRSTRRESRGAWGKGNVLKGGGKRVVHSSGWLKEGPARRDRTITVVWRLGAAAANKPQTGIKR
jgi:hypothetical protein